MAMAGITRVSDQMRIDTLLNNLQRGNLSLGQLQQQLATGDRLLSPSVDPTAANGALSLQKTLEQQEQVLANLTKATNTFNMADSSISAAADALLSAATLAHGSIGTVVDQQQRQANAEIIASLTREMLNIANTRVGDVYIFGGSANTAVPFVDELGGVRYVGSVQSMVAMLGDADTSEIGLTGNEVFGALSSEVAGYKDLTPAMSTQNRLADLSGAAEEGIRLSTIVIKDNSGTYNVDLTGADRLSDIMDKINTATGGAVTVGIAPGGKRLFLLSATGNMTITELGAGRAAHDLGIYR
ncbi:MAG: hypothetical protein HQ546_02240, partial [Planctomycetes bacterium]|nr:hypothetical protein [Planctomycetota bacterium]